MSEQIKQAKLKKGERISAYKDKMMIMKWKDKKDLSHEYNSLNSYRRNIKLDWREIRTYPQKSLKCLSQETGVSVSSVQRASQPAGMPRPRVTAVYSCA